MGIVSPWIWHVYHISVAVTFFNHTTLPRMQDVPRPKPPIPHVDYYVSHLMTTPRAFLRHTAPLMPKN